MEIKLKHWRDEAEVAGALDRLAAFWQTFPPTYKNHHRLAERHAEIVRTLISLADKAAEYYEEADEVDEQLATESAANDHENYMHMRDIRR